MNKKNLLITLSLMFTSPFTIGKNDVDTSLQFNQGEKVTLAFIERKEGGGKAENQYLRETLQLVKEGGLRQVQLMPVVKTMIGESKTDAFGIYAWSDAKTLKELRNNNIYQDKLVPLQKLAWNELTFSDISIHEPLSYQLSKNKLYTVAEIWLKDEALYHEYFEATNSLRKLLNAQIVFKVSPENYISLYNGATPPNYLILVEWESEENIAKYPEHEIFKSAYPLFEAGVSQFNWHQVSLLTDNY